MSTFTPTSQPKLLSKCFALLWLLGVCLPLHAQAQSLDCVIETPESLSLPTYDPTSAPAATAWQIKVRSFRGCNVRLQIENLDAPGRLVLARGGSQQGMQLSLQSQAYGGIPVQPAPAEAGGFKLGTGQEATLILWLRADATQWIDAGAYAQTLAVRLVRANGATADYRETRVVGQVRPTARASFGAISNNSQAGSSVARLDFGELQTGAQRSTSLEVLANTEHTLTIASSAGGRLVNRQNPSSSIAWRLRINGQPVALAAGTMALPFQARGRIQYQLEAQIGSVERVLAGEYADDVLITITAQ